MFFKNADVALYCIDLSRLDETLEFLENEAYENCSDEKWSKILVGCKLDKKCVSPEEEARIKLYKQKIGAVAYYETSSFHYVGLEEVFDKVVEMGLEKIFRFE